MALSTPVALTAVASGALSTLTSAAYTPTANGIQVAFISATGSINGQTLNSVSSTHAGQGAWTIVKFTPAGSSSCCAAIAYSVTGASPGSGTFTATFAAAGTDNELFVAETTGQDTTTPVTGTNSAGAATTSTTPVLTLSSAPATGDITFVTFAGRNIGAAPSVPSGTGAFTSLASNNHANPCASIMGSYRLSSTSTNITPAGMGTIANAGAAIVVQAASGSTPITLSETGAGTDAISETATVPIAETGSGTDALAANAAVTQAETGAGVDAIAVARAAFLTDTGTGTDSLSTNATVALSETATGADAISVAATITLTDTGTGVDAVASVSIPKAVTDTGSGADAISANAAVPLSDARPAATDALVVNASTSLSDTATGLDDIQVSTGPTNVSLSESSSAVEAIAVAIASLEIHFSSPVRQSISDPHDVWWRHTTSVRTTSILKFGSAYEAIQGPSAEQIEAADKTYLGGHDYIIDAAEAAALTAAGFGAGLS